MIAVPLLFMISASLAAQPARGDSIPRELALAVLGAVAGDPGAWLREGVPADNLPAGVIPSGATILGSMSFGRTGATVIRMSVAPITAADSLRRILEGSGWTAAPVQAAIDMRAFHMNPGGRGAPVSPPPPFFCKGTEIIRLQTLNSVQGTTVVIRHDQGRSVAACDGPPTSPVYSPDVPYPALVAHPDVQYVSGSANSGVDDFYAHQRATTTMSLAALMTHYSRQLEAAGWVLQDSITSGNLITRSFTLASRPVEGAGARSGRTTGDWICVMTMTRASDGRTTDLHFWGQLR
jgi:hypothetical protein